MLVEQKELIDNYVTIIDDDLDFDLINFNLFSSSEMNEKNKSIFFLNE